MCGGMFCTSCLCFSFPTTFKSSLKYSLHLFLISYLPPIRFPFYPDKSLPLVGSLSFLS
jgi:hypothetical protein